tara:strand:- start:8222 stop:8716 length:495 start_codon:yes stop_codon:yes gene_type:complete
LKYLLDSNTYIQAKNFYYNMEFCPAYWDWLDAEYEKGNLASIANVYDELKVYGDELSSWVKKRKNHFVEDSDDATQEKFAEVAEYVANLANKKPEHIANFLDKADPWLIAKASTLKATIVTHERLDPPSSKNVKIPNICQVFEVEYISTYDLLRRLEAQFILSL